MCVGVAFTVSILVWRACSNDGLLVQMQWFAEIGKEIFKLSVREKEGVHGAWNAAVLYEITFIASYACLVKGAFVIGICDLCCLAQSFEKLKEQARLKDISRSKNSL